MYFIQKPVIRLVFKSKANFYRKRKPEFKCFKSAGLYIFKGHTGIPELWTPVLGTVLQTLDSAYCWIPPLHVSDCLIFYYGNLILHLKNKRKWYEHKSYDERQQKMPKKYIKALSNIFYELAPVTHDVICSKLKRDGENILASYCQTNTLSGCWTLETGLWTLYSGSWTLDAGHNFDAGFWTLDTVVDSTSSLEQF